ncbi:hypothetical protein [Chitinophaga sancti]|uniref:MoxR-vWA-beta-propeller ternary system domain-containing protein n=1 Tax=Chitinophaga sancti TaxID=1004 RepID=A0A1K1RQC9_9BACT|nr:hypothetical protein [Chitinophaga sancti]WQD62503.1 hypothetical protein U0033_31925 [Chitinophaga sancti]WQG91928.1 hypothetical protein SR876_10460 [Chitinophaga sancti]SFW74262.1 hypothetical protein SAMN05661012_04129 [Chitinophaga sancti]
MELTEFISGLINEGNVTVAADLLSFEEADLRTAAIHLQQYYEDDCREMPYTAPALDMEAARWAAGYLYTTVQFILLRNLDASLLETHLPAYKGERTAAAIYSADLTLRYLPDLFLLAKGLSPEDPLIARFYQTAHQWPFSAAAIPLTEQVDLSAINEHPSLRQAYTDRIIQARNLSQCRLPENLPFVQAALGTHAAILWPQFDTVINEFIL